MKNCLQSCSTTNRSINGSNSFSAFENSMNRLFYIHWAMSGKVCSIKLHYRKYFQSFWIEMSDISLLAAPSGQQSISLLLWQGKPSASQYDGPRLQSNPDRSTANILFPTYRLCGVCACAHFREFRHAWKYTHFGTANVQFHVSKHAGWGWILLPATIFPNLHT